MGRRVSSGKLVLEFYDSLRLAVARGKRLENGVDLLQSLTLSVDPVSLGEVLGVVVRYFHLAPEQVLITSESEEGR